MGRNRTKALGKLYKKITNTELPTDANTTTEALQKVYEALTNDNKHHINVTDIIEDLAANWSGGGSGGGGSSDFSTAEVTVINNTEEMVSAYFPIIMENPSACLTMNTAQIGTYTYNVPLYKGMAILGGLASATVTGDAEIDPEYNDILITGDCTITVGVGGPN